MEHSEQADIRAVERRAAARARLSPGGIGAAVVLHAPPDEEGRSRLRVRISDGLLFGWVDVLSTDPGVSAATVEAAVERHASELPRDNRLEAVEALSPLAHG